MVNYGWYYHVDYPDDLVFQLVYEFDDKVFFLVDGKIFTIDYHTLMIYFTYDPLYNTPLYHTLCGITS